MAGECDKVKVWNDLGDGRALLVHEDLAAQGVEELLNGLGHDEEVGLDHLANLLGGGAVAGLKGNGYRK